MSSPTDWKPSDGKSGEAKTTGQGSPPFGVGLPMCTTKPFGNTRKEKAMKKEQATRPTDNLNAQKSDVMAARRRVWGDAVEMCNYPGCDKEAAPHSCYCEECEEKID